MIWRNGMRALALCMATSVALSGSLAPASASKKGDKVAAGVAGAAIGALIGAAAANSNKYKPAPAYPPPYQPGYAPSPYPAASPVQICLGYGNKYSQKSGALGLRLDSVVSVTPTSYNQQVVGAYMTVLWAGYQQSTYVTCTVTNGTVTSWLVA